jgi:Gamma-glutamyltranspeptidase
MTDSLTDPGTVAHEPDLNKIVNAILTADSRWVSDPHPFYAALRTSAPVFWSSAADGLDPQAALDRPRFWVDGPLVRLEEALCPRTGELERLGYRTVCDEDTFGFGGGQAILVDGEALVGGSDPRKDGYAAGF